MTAINRRPSIIAAAALEEARKAVGITEKPAYSCDGPEVRKYLQLVGMQPGNTWDTAFVCSVFWTACRDRGEVFPLKMTGGAMELLQKSKGKFVKRFYSEKEEIHEDMLKPGDIFVQLNAGIAHTGIIENAFAGGVVTTIEGCTASDRKKECAGVQVRRRAVSTLFAVIRVCD